MLAVIIASASASASPSPSSSSSPSADGTIDSVVVFADRARVTRTRAAHCEHGTAQAVFDHLPATLDTRTLRGDVVDAPRAQAQAEVQAQVIGLSGDLVNEEAPTEGRARELVAEADRKRAEIRAAEAKKASLTAEIEAVNAYADVLAATLTEEIRNPRPSPPVWGRSMDAVRARLGGLSGERRKLDVALRGLALDLDKLERQIAALGAGNGRAHRTATVTIDCRALGQVTAALSYVVPGATWAPEYDLAWEPARGGKAGDGAVRLTLGAVVRQSSGESWDGVRLALSTARPKLGAEAPQPAPLVVDGYPRGTDKVLVEGRERRDSLRGGGAAAGPAGPQSAALDDKGNAFLLTLPHRVTVAADGRPVWAPVDVMETRGTTKLVAVPKLDAHVYQVVSLKNPAGYPLLAGRVRSYRGGSYMGDARLEYRGAGEPFEVSMGIDEELKIERKTLDEKDRAPGLLSTTKQIGRAFRHVLTSRAAGDVTVELREGIPVSKIDDVKVELAAAQTTPGYQLDAARGFLTWTIALKSGEEKKVDVGYVIRLPDSWRLGN